MSLLWPSTMLDEIGKTSNTQPGSSASIYYTLSEARVLNWGNCTLPSPGDTGQHLETHFIVTMVEVLLEPHP